MLHDKTAVVTGASRGIGRAVAKAIAREGAFVVCAARSKADLDALASEIGGAAMTVDLSSRASVEAFAAEVLASRGRVDVLVNNAGIAESAPLAATTDASFDRMMQVNVAAPLALARAFVPGMVAAGWGRVVNVASNAGLVGYAYTSAYCASKHAVVGLTRALAAELAEAGVTVNAVCPGWVDTELLAGAVANIAKKTGRSEDDARKTLARMSPQRRLFTADEVAHVAVALLADGMRGVHGQAIAIDGGQTA